MRSGPRRRPTIKPYMAPSGGYGSLKSVGEILLREGLPVKNAALMMSQNKPEGFMCVSCAWAKPAKPQPFEYCENGAKATAWEVTKRRVDEKFFARHAMRELEGWVDYDLEEAGRLTHPMRWDAGSDKYVPVAWETAFEEIGRELRALQSDPDQTVFYASGRASLETSYMWQLFARMYGTNNLPDSSNMCHESTSVALPESIGVSVGTVTLQDFEITDLIMYVGHNPATSSPRILHQLQDAVKRGAKILGFNPLRERGLEKFVNPQDPVQMASQQATDIADEIYQLKPGGDIAWTTGVAKALIAMDDAAVAEGAAGPTPRDLLLAQTDSDGGYSIKAAGASAKNRRVLDHDFIAEHTHGFDAFADWCRAADWTEIERTCGLSRAQLEAVARAYAKADTALIVYGMGVTQHVGGVEGVQMLVNLLLLRGNIGKPGAGICPVRGHSNVQGQRTVGISEKPENVPLDRLKELYNFEPPRHEGFTTVTACEAMISGKVKAFIALGGNFVRATPDQDRVEGAWKRLRLTVAIATKLNRSHVIHGQVAYVLPCLGRIEIDEQASGPQAVSMESSLAHFHGSKGHVKPASPKLRSEPAIVAGLAKATLPASDRVPWDAWVGNYALVRDAIETTWPATFPRFNERLFQPGGVMRPLAARERKWNTRSGKANFVVPRALFAGAAEGHLADGVFQLTTMRSNDQFNTTVYGYNDRFRGVRGTRLVVFMNVADMTRLGLKADAFVTLECAITDGVQRRVAGLRVVPYGIPEGVVGAYFPEANPLVPLGHHDRFAQTPAYKAVPVRVVRSKNV